MATDLILAGYSLGCNDLSGSPFPLSCNRSLFIVFRFPAEISGRKMFAHQYVQFLCYSLFFVPFLCYFPFLCYSMFFVQFLCYSPFFLVFPLLINSVLVISTPHILSKLCASCKFLNAPPSSSLVVYLLAVPLNCFSLTLRLSTPHCLFSA